MLFCILGTSELQHLSTLSPFVSLFLIYFLMHCVHSNLLTVQISKCLITSQTLPVVGGVL